MTNANKRAGAVLSAVMTAMAAGCTSGDSGPPPLFNAKDLSQQCPTGQIGWDFSTGGNDTAVVENSVSREITVDSATLGTCNYKADFAASCDGKQECVRLGKLSTSPTCAGGQLQLTYHCGTEAAKYNLVIDDAAAKSVTLACRDVITIYSAVYGSNATSKTNQADITTAVGSRCTGTRRCSTDDPYVLNNRNDPWENVAKDTKVRYYCGSTPTLMETVVPSGQRIDILCPTSEIPLPNVEQAIRIKSVTCGSGTTADGVDSCSATLTSDQRTAIASWEGKLRAACQGKATCKLPITNKNGGSFLVNYWCTGPEAAQSKLFIDSTLYSDSVSLSCGPPIHILSADGNAGNVQLAKDRCEYKSTCVLPDLQTDGGKGTFSTQYHYACGENYFDVRAGPSLRQTTTYTSGANKFAKTEAFDRQIECPATQNVLRGGIRVVSANIGGDRLLDVTSQCFGRATCNYQSNTSTGTITYRCGSSLAVKTASFNGILPMHYELSCKPDVKIIDFKCESLDKVNDPNQTSCVGIDGKQYEIDLQTMRNRCGPGNNGFCDVWKWGPQVGHMTWQCGEDPLQYHYDGVGLQGTGIMANYVHLVMTCDVPDKPYVAKACVPDSCPGNTRRDGKLACIPDSTKTPVIVYSAPILNQWLAGTDGGVSSQWGGPAVTTLKEDVPYQLFSATQYTTPGGVQLPPTTAVTLWAYDEFTANTDAGVSAANATTYGFRCVLAEAPIRDGEVAPTVTGYRAVFSGGKGGTLPLSCFRQDVDDGRNAWTDGARRVGIPESQFRAKYSRKTSWVVSSFDPTGKFTARYYNKALLTAPNPVGFFYNNTNGWIDQLSFYLQSGDLRYKTAVTFQESTGVELSAMGAVLRQAVAHLDVTKPTLLPAFDVDFTWYKRGDSPAKNPLSPHSLLSPTTGLKTLDQRSLTARIELARVDGSMANEWVTLNSTQFPVKGLGDGNALSQTVRLSAQLTPELRDRLLSVRGTADLQRSDGWMLDFTEDNTAFKVRVCMDFDGDSHAVSDNVATDAKPVTVVRDGVTYSLGFKNRCAETALLLVTRELFVYPTVPYETTEQPLNTAASPRQGDRTASSNNDLGNQSTCTDTGGTQKCSGASRTNMDTGGQFSQSLVESETDTENDQGETTKTSTLSTEMKLFGFQVFNLAGGGSAGQAPGHWEVTINLEPDLDNIIEAVKKRRQTGGIKTDAEHEKMKEHGGFERDGMAMKLSKEFAFTLGPFPFTLEVGFSVGFGFGVAVKISGDHQSVNSMMNPDYPCLQTGSATCMQAYPDMDTPGTKSFEDASAECSYKGGRLAEVRTADDLSKLNDAVTALGSGTLTKYWLGAQLSYQYSDPRCDVTHDAKCAGTSRTRYAWLTGNTAFATQYRAETTKVDTTTEGFGANPGSLVTQVPNRAAVLLDKSTGKLATAVTSTTAAYVCEFDPAGSYTKGSLGIELSVEFAAGFFAELCTPSSEFGFCLTAHLDLIKAGVAVGAERSRIVVFNNSKLKVSLLGDSTVSGAWEVAFISGGFDAEIHYFFGSASWEIASYEGLYKIEGELFPTLHSPYRSTP